MDALPVPLDAPSSIDPRLRSLPSSSSSASSRLVARGGGPAGLGDMENAPRHDDCGGDLTLASSSTDLLVGGVDNIVSLPDSDRLRA